MRVLDDFPLATLREFIDWTPFFHTWELKGVYPRILEHEKYGEQARQIFAEAQRRCSTASSTRSCSRRAASTGFFPANAVGDDVELYATRAAHEVLERFHFLRQQADDGRESRTLPVARRLRRAEGDRPAGSHRRLRGHHRHRV